MSDDVTTTQPIPAPTTAGVLNFQNLPPWMWLAVFLLGGSGVGGASSLFASAQQQAEMQAEITVLRGDFRRLGEKLDDIGYAVERYHRKD